MFEDARIKLTAWYLLIIMFVSIFFSLAIYQVLNVELERVERVQRLRQVEGIQRRPVIDPEVIEETKTRLRTFLFLINLGVLGISSAAGYFLAGRTLKPIKDMVEEQGRFVTDASHELRTPLTSLKSEIEISLRDKKLTLTDAKQVLQSNMEEVNNLQYLSDNLIKLTQYQKANGNFEEFNLLEIVSESKRKLNILAKRKNIKIKEDIENQIIKGERQGLIELFVILLDNAIKYSPKGTTVNILSKTANEHIKISVSDKGVGIDEKDLPHLFDRFFRADKSRTKLELKGYGLGLSIAKQIVLRHSGSIVVASNLGKGTTFTVSLPSNP